MPRSGNCRRVTGYFCRIEGSRSNGTGTSSASFPSRSSAAKDDALQELDTRLRQVVGSQMVSDVPLGAFLSGGIDSGLVVSYMAELSREPVKTFSISFEDEICNELPLARIVAERYGTDHHELVVRPNAVDLLSRMVEHFGEPFGDSSCIPTYLVSQLARNDVTVCLSGDGGDEVFAGYAHYVKVAAIDKLRILPRPLLAAARGMASWSIAVRTAVRNGC